jgi:Phage integrase family
MSTNECTAHHYLTCSNAASLLADAARSSGTVRNWLAAAANTAGLSDVDGGPLAFSPHDFRRVFLTDAVRTGLPIHIAAQLAGHDDLNSTRRYAATYPTEVIEHYQQFMTRRRAERPIEEYREPTTEELNEFGEHFGRRRVELGDCVGPYGTGCTHEHACIRCSFLQIDPAQADRLASIQADINERITAARDNGWLGDVEQLQLTLGHL